MKRKINNYGFTLIELLVVMAIIGLLATIVLVSLNDSRARARDTKRKADLRQLQVALELYASNNNGTYPEVADYRETDSGGWDYSKSDINNNGIFFLDPLVQGGYLSDTVDPLNNGVGDALFSYAGSGSSTNDYAYGYFNYCQWGTDRYLLGVNMETNRDETAGPPDYIYWVMQEDISCN